jgi:hypothetical protein
VTTFRRATQQVGVLALAAPLSGAALLLAAAPALAATGITSPGDGTPYDSDANVHIAAAVDRGSSSTVDLRLKSPTASSAQTVATGSTSLTAGASLSYDFDTATCASFPASCSGRAEAPNGTWTITLVSGGKAVDTRTFVLRIPPRAPSGFSASASGYRAVDLTWTKGVEPDLTGWTLYADGSRAQDIGTDACSNSSCAATITYAQDGTGSHTYSLVAHRSVAPGSSDTLDSPQSQQATATLDAPPPPPPSPAPSSNGSGSTSSSTGGTSSGSTGATSPSSTGSTGGSTGSSSTGGSTGSSSSASGSSSTGGSSSSSKGGSSSAIATSSAPVTVDSRKAFALSFQAFAPKLGIPKLPPLPATITPAVAPLPDGTYQKTLGYKDVVKTTRIDSPQAAARRVTSVVGSALDSSQLLRSIAGALVLLLAAAHLRRWLGNGHAD